MKWRTVLFVLIAGLAAAAAPAQTQTQPMAGTPEPLTVTGTVVSINGSQLVLDTASGRRTFVIDMDSTAVPTTVVVGVPVSVRYHDMGPDRLHLAAVTVVESPSTTTTTPVAPTTADEPAEPALPRVSTPEPTQAAPATTPAPATDTTAERTLPATASGVPLAGLIGLLALAGGLATRYLR